jgi:exopolysaccharide biosynthesis polyprenyl glycosylphosphotransferase
VWEPAVSTMSKDRLIPSSRSGALSHEDDAAAAIVDRAGARRESPHHRANSPAESRAGAFVVLARYRRQALALDAAAAVLGSCLALAVRFATNPPARYVIASLILPLAWVAVVAVYRGYESRLLGAGPEEYRRVMNAGLLLITSIAVLSFAANADVSRIYVVLAVPVTLAVSMAGRRHLRTRLFHLRTQGAGMSRVVVVGRPDAAVSLIEKLNAEPQHGLKVAAACVPMLGVSVDHIHGIPVLGHPDDVLEAVDTVRADAVAVVSHPDLSGHALRRLSWALEERGVELIVSPGIVEVAGPRLSIRPVAGLSLLHLERPSASGGKMLLKAVFDRSLGTLICLGLLPLMGAVAIAVRTTSRGPAIFKQTRIGRDGGEFTMYKFRSMVVDAETRLADLRGCSEGNGMLFKLRADPRVTRVGGFLRRYSLDELPQLFNVVRGDMSLVGPRPPLPSEVLQYDADAVRRLKVLPGLTGLWQVSGRSDLSWEESLLLDLRYVDNWSIPLDLSILWRTVKIVLGHGRGAY